MLAGIGMTPLWWTTDNHEVSRKGHNPTVNCRLSPAGWTVPSSKAKIDQSGSKYDHSSHSLVLFLDHCLQLFNRGTVSKPSSRYIVAHHTLRLSRQRRKQGDGDGCGHYVHEHQRPRGRCGDDQQKREK